MTIKTKTIVAQMLVLRNSLVSSGNGASHYFQCLIDGLAASEGDQCVVKLLMQIKSGSKIVELANFSCEQEGLWLGIWAEATRLLN